ncbi:conserved hypothetical protein [Leishmania braziliensis MHOM/BR/75/M2904]|uniref:Uncharacterized protein n=2 Tax=Leishmania braziliensis TaxID=5660 RepID=A4HLF0_LEIBR|nr:conserved hypothetical protein [Leishmania braziliensis MHOM/BR/75/M2904]CAJ2479379.1 unnamed protein product [Leishmania braziliensis]CAM40645.1 conserved hypothetical protein [Leishmania braziliensis MHOM/BR/75/M2904]
MTSNAAHYAATLGANLHEWVLAVKQPSPPTVAAAPSTVVDAAQEGGVRKTHSASAVAYFPLEERIGLPELKSILCAFQAPPHGAVTRWLDTSSSKGSGSGTADRVVALRALDTSRSVDELSVIVADLPRSPNPAQRPGQQRTRDATDVHSSAAGKGHMHSPALSLPLSAPTLGLRSLSQEEFIRAIQSAVPSATVPDILSLLRKAISETQETVSWSELTAFLVTRSRQKADVALENQRFVLGGPPRGMRFDDQHGSPITCVAMEPVRRLLVTGCSDGSVRAWSSGNDLVYRGLLLQVDKWIVGLHWGCKQRVLYVVTMDRWVYILSGSTYEVLRVYHGRGITESSVNMTYASETIGTVHVGGVPQTKSLVSSARSYGGVRLVPPGISPFNKSKTSLSPRPPTNRSGSCESHKERMQRLLSSAMHACRAVHTTSKETATPEHPHRSTSTQTDATSTTVSTSASQVSSSGTPMPSLLPTSSLAMVYSLTTTDAAEALHQDNTPLTGAGRGPYVRQELEEGVLTALVDPVTATAFHESALQEDVLLLGTSTGDVFLFQLAHQNHLSRKRVLVARHIFRQLHRGRVTKLHLLLSLHALVSSGDDGHVRVTSLVAGQPLRAFYAAGLPDQHASVTDFDVHPQLKMLLTVGPERRALVWEWSQPLPIALLGPANSPCCGAAFMGDQVLTMSLDGVLHVYDCKGFHFQQELSLATAGSLDRFGGAVGATHSVISRMHVDEARKRVLCFGHFPLSLCVKWQVSSDFPERYRGHHAPMLTTLSSRVFGQVVTVGTDGVVMTWMPRSGVKESSFLLSNFSNTTSASAPIRPTAASMDVLQRRLLTGFANGVMVVWSILNGQVERVLTAAAATASPSPSLSPAALGGTAKKTMNSMSGSSSSSPVVTSSEWSVTATAAVAIPSTRRDVTAVGSLLRHRSISYIFAIGSHLYVDAAVDRTGAAARSSGPQLGEYSTTPASSWTVPSALGDVTMLVQLGPQLIGCSTASGAVLLYNVLFERQEGAPLWVRESLLSPAWATGGLLSPTPTSAAMGGDVVNIGGPSALPQRNSTVSAAGPLMSSSGTHSQRTVPGAATLFLASLVNTARATGTPEAASADSTTPAAVMTGAVVSRVNCMMTLPTVHPRLLLVGQEDGTVSFWHTLRRVCLGAVSLTTAAGVEDAKQGEGAIVIMSMEETDGRMLVFGDGEGKVHVCLVKWKLLTDSHEQTAALAMPNFALYSLTPTPKEEQLPAVAASTTSASDDAQAAERSLPVLQQLERVHVFASGLALSGIRVVHAEETAPLGCAAAPPPKTDTEAEAAATALEEDRDSPADSISLGARKDTGKARLLIICTGVDHYVRVFTLAGVPIGELGMDAWDAARPSTFRFMGEPTVPPAVPLPCSPAGNFNWQQEEHNAITKSGCYHDYLADLYATHHTRPEMPVGSSSELTHGGSVSLRRAMGGSVYFECTGSPPSHAAARTSLAPRPSLPDAMHPLDRVGSATTVDKLPSYGHPSVAVFAENAEAGTGLRRELCSDVASGFLLSGLRPGQTGPPKHCLTARLRQNTRHRYETGRHFRGVLKRAYAHQLQDRNLQGHTSPFLSYHQPRAAPSELPILLLSGPEASCAAESGQAETRSVSLSAASESSDSAEQRRVTGYVLGALEQATNTSASLREEPREPCDMSIAPRRSTVCAVSLAKDARCSITPRHPSMTSTDAPLSVGGSPVNRRRQSRTMVATPFGMGMVAQCSLNATETLFLNPLSPGGLSLIKQPSLVHQPPPLPVVHSSKQSTSADTQTPPSSYAVSTAVPMLTAVAHCGSNAALSALAPASAAPRDVLINRAGPLSATASQAQSGAVVGQHRSTPALSYLVHEHTRLVENTRTAAAREKLAALAIPVPTHPVSTGITGGSAAVDSLRHLSIVHETAARFSCSTSPSLVPAWSVLNHLDSVVEKQQRLLECRTSAAQELTNASQGFLAHVTSRMYVTPVEELPAPSLECSRRHHLAATPPTTRTRR